MTTARPLLALLPALLLLGTAGWPWSKPEPPVVVEVIATPPPPPPPQHGNPLWDGTLPMDLGPLPAGLATPSAQGCAACHWTAHETWERSSHSAGKPSEAFVAAVASVNRADCWSCHRPLAQQHAELVAWNEDTPEETARAPNPSWSPTLMTEGVTCVACHVRDGTVLSAQPAGEAPHPLLHAPELLETGACASCHQMTWPGATQPLYDTVGEYERSAYAKAGMTCLDCHGRPAAGLEGVISHDVHADIARALTVETSLSASHATRGGAPLTVTLRLLNTGSAHALPTGSPWRGVVVQAEVVATDDEGAAKTGPDPLRVALARVLADSPPFETTSDTRLQPGEVRVVSGDLALPLDLPGGPCEVRVTARYEVAGKPDPKPFASWSIPIVLD